MRTSGFSIFLCFPQGPVNPTLTTQDEEEGDAEPLTEEPVAARMDEFRGRPSPCVESSDSGCELASISVESADSWDAPASPTVQSHDSGFHPTSPGDTHENVYYNQCIMSRPVTVTALVAHIEDMKNKGDAFKLEYKVCIWYF